MRLTYNISYTIGIQQLLQATELFDVDDSPWIFRSVMDQDGMDVKIGFHLVPPAESLASLHEEKTKSTDSEDGEHEGEMSSE